MYTYWSGCDCMQIIITSTNTDDGSCQFIGCTDEAYIEYDPVYNQDTDPTSCFTINVYGCTNSIAFNYDSFSKYR